jgi:hypothetical protein
VGAYGQVARDGGHLGRRGGPPRSHRLSGRLFRDLSGGARFCGTVTCVHLWCYPPSASGTLRARRVHWGRLALTLEIQESVVCSSPLRRSVVVRFKDKLPEQEVS